MINASKNSFVDAYQRWSPPGRPWPRGRPRGHILKSLALASKVKSLASRPQVLENWPVLLSILFIDDMISSSSVNYNVSPYLHPIFNKLCNHDFFKNKLE